MTETPDPRPARSIDPLAIAALVLALIAYLPVPGVGYVGGIAIGLVAGLLAVLLGVAGAVGAARGGSSRAMLVISVIAIALGAVGGLIAFTGGIRLAS